MTGQEVSAGDARMVATFAKRITQRWSFGVEVILDVGRVLIEAKAALPHGAFEEMVEKQLPFGPRTARMLMAIARHDWLANRNHVPILPPAWSTLYEMSRLPSEALDKAFSDGLIKPDMERSDVKLLGRPPRPAPGEVPPLKFTGANYRAILADPSWDWETWSDRGQVKSPSMHYAPMSAREIMALPVSELAADDAVLVLWSTWPHQPLAHATIEAWGFRYVTGGSWFKSSRTGEKQAFGMGHILRNACDPFLVATIGRPATSGSSLRNAIDGAAVEGSIREHSRKPDSIYDLIEALVPGGPYLELFARQRRPGWDAWGSEIDKFRFEEASDGDDIQA